MVNLCLYFAEFKQTAVEEAGCIYTRRSYWDWSTMGIPCWTCPWR